MSTQDEPVEAGHDDAGSDAKLEGLVEQMREDMKQGHIDDLETVLRDRLNDIGETVDGAELARLIEQIKL